MIRIAAVGDLHYGAGSTDILRPSLQQLPSHADLLLLAGDLTRCGGTDEVAVLADDLRGLAVPVVAVLGNHDYQADREDEVRKVLEDAGVVVLEGEAVTLDINGTSIGVAGTKGFGGGFRGAHGTDFGEPEMKAFVHHTKMLSDRLERALNNLRTDFRIALLHYSPIEATLEGERLEIYPFLGSYLLAEAIDNAGADLVFHGHAHHGSEKGRTPAGIPVRNVAQPVIRHAYNVYTLGAAPAAELPASAPQPSTALRTGTGSGA
ncbi:MAG TPA: metallophosphoesterase [Candidatus Dormibacteraeota bacterium]|jgi:Icc-related predicted phosphoesterase|nr:metallophosphoesterase [Candidatus Dormibacteraeota bacterium]